MSDCIERRIPSVDKLKKALSTVYDEMGALYTWYIWWVYVRPLVEEDEYAGKTSGYYVILNNAALHSSVLATRKLAEFFKARPKQEEKDDDLRAYDFPGFDNIGDVMLRDDLTEIHKRVAHMTYREVETGATSYELKVAIHELLLPRCLSFLDYLEYRFFADDEKEKHAVRQVRSGITGMSANWNKISELLKLSERKTNTEDYNVKIKRPKNFEATAAEIEKHLPNREAKLLEDQLKRVFPDGFSIRDEGNAIVAYAFRNTSLEKLHAGKHSDLLNDASYSRITNDEMKALMIEACRKMEAILCMKKENPQHYENFIRTIGTTYCQGWERQ